MASVPINERLKIDKALVQERPPLDSVEAIYKDCKLHERYGVDLEAFENYARCVREVHSIGYADRLACELLADDGAAGREARMDLMTSRLAQRIARLLAEDDELGVSDLARLASSAAALRRAVTQAERGRKDRTKDSSPEESPSSKLRRAVRELYGLDLALDEAKGAKGGERANG